MFLILEGLDNVGKDTQIKKLTTYLVKKCKQLVHVIHYSAISGITPEESREYSEHLYYDMFDIMAETDFMKMGTSLIFNRSHIGEHVYSPIYRNYSGEYVFDIEQKFINSSFWPKVYLVVFIDNPENLIKRDDGLSFSTKMENKKLEIELFVDAYYKSHITHKCLINICDKGPNVVYNKIIEFIEGENA